ncbi:MAG TPA: VOC family protein [Haliangiales bacterium]|nr:VOC family protein [Haliangiales bacterium]
MKLGQVMVFAKDMELMRRFYRDGVGLTPVDEADPEGNVFQIADA